MRNSQQDGSPVRPLSPDWHLSPWEEEHYLMRTVLMVAIVVMPGCDEIECGKSSMDSKLGFKQVLAITNLPAFIYFRVGKVEEQKINIMAEMKTQKD